MSENITINFWKHKYAQEKEINDIELISDSELLLWLAEQEQERFTVKSLLSDDFISDFYTKWEEVKNKREKAKNSDNELENSLRALAKSKDKLIFTNSNNGKLITGLILDYGKNFKFLIKDVNDIIFDSELANRIKNSVMSGTSISIIFIDKNISLENYKDNWTFNFLVESSKNKNLKVSLNILDEPYGDNVYIPIFYINDMNMFRCLYNSNEKTSYYCSFNDSKQTKILKEIFLQKNTIPLKID